MTFYPTGAIVAAPTTSLPEVIGGQRNRDYRYTWVRDASLTLQAPWVAACPDEAGKFFQLLATAGAGQLVEGEELQITYGVGGERDLSERGCPTFRVGVRVRRYGSATLPGGSVGWTCTGNCWTPPQHCPNTSLTWTRTPADSLQTSPTRPPQGGNPRTGGSGGPGRAPPLPALKAYVLGGRGPRHQHCRPPRRHWQGSSLAGSTGADRCGKH